MSLRRQQHVSASNLDDAASHFDAPPFIITISGVSGAGKSSTVNTVADLLGDACTFHFDDYGEQMQQPEDALEWIRAGADLSQFRLTQFGVDVTHLRNGETVITPTGRTVTPGWFIVIEEPFGRGRTDMRELVDFSVCIDLPMEIALARRLQDAIQRWEGSAESRLQWMDNYLDAYLSQGMREVYLAINEQVKQGADLVLDGTLPVAGNAQSVVDSVRSRIGGAHLL